MVVNVRLVCFASLAYAALLAGCSTPAPRPQTAPASSATFPAREQIAVPPSLPNANSALTGDANQTNDAATNAAADTARLGDEVALRALSLVGKPYRYGGADLDGFDCSGLVYFIYHQLGIDVPRTAQDQQREATRVTRKELEPGDLVFFRLRPRGAISHVGIYVGENRFVHAPQSGKLIELRALDDQYFAARWVATGRLD